MLRLVGTHQIRDMLGVSRSYAAQIVNRKGFPDPVGRLGKAQIWLADDVEAWAHEHNREVYPYDEEK
jgi:prophage regulatory protein